MSTPGQQLGPNAPLEQPLAVTTGASVLGGSLWRVVSTVLPQAYVLLLSVVAARFLGPDGMGRQSFIAFVELSLIALLATGLSTALMRQVGEAVGLGRPGAVGWLFRWTLRLQIVTAAAGATMLAAVGLAGAEPRAAWILAGGVCAAGVLHTVPSAVLIGLQRWRAATVAGLVTGGVATAGTVAVLALGGGITGMFAVECAAAVAILVWTLVLARRALRAAPPPTPSRDLVVRMRGVAGLVSIGIVIELVLWRRSEFFFLAKFSSDSEIAYYSVAFAVVLALVRLPGVAASVLSPAVANLLGAGDSERIRSGYSRAIRLIALVTAPLVFVAIALGPRAIRVVWGEDFAAAGTPFLIMAAAGLILPFSDLSYSLLTGLARLRVPLLIDGIAAAINIALALTLVPDHGAVGAAVATTIAQLSAAVPVLFYSSRIMGGIAVHPFELLPGAIAGAAAGAAAWAGVLAVEGAIGLALGAAAAVVAFAALARLLRIIPAEDAVWLDERVGARLGGAVGRLCRLWGAGRSG